MNRRQFLKSAPLIPLAVGAADDSEILRIIDFHRPTKLRPNNFSEIVGATHVAGKYHLTDKPFLLEGADQLLALGTRLGKFWFIPHGAKNDYRWNSKWENARDFVDLAKTQYFQELFRKPFRTFVLEAHCREDDGWRNEQPENYYQNLSDRFEAITRYLYETYSTVKVDFVLQHWEGDWLLRGRGGETWDLPPKDAKVLCERMQRWLAARQAGVTRGRSARREQCQCNVFHAAEVNRVADAWKGIPTMVRDVLPKVELDLVSYSCYDGMKDPITLWKCLGEIRRNIKLTGAAGQNGLYIGEIGIPENEQPEKLAERWDKWLAVALAAKVRYIIHWQLYCNELAKTEEKPPIKDLKSVRGFWLIKPDGELSEAGKYFRRLWQKM